MDTNDILGHQWTTFATGVMLICRYIEELKIALCYSRQMTTGKTVCPYPPIG